MTKYSINASPQMASSHRFLIGPPLFVVSLFCFGFVLMQPHNSTQAKTAASNRSALPVSSSQPTPLPQASQASLPKLTQETTGSVAADTISQPNTDLSTSSITSQVSNTGATASLQSASPNTQTTYSRKTTPTLKTSITTVINKLKL